MLMSMVKCYWYDLYNLAMQHISWVSIEGKYRNPMVMRLALRYLITGE